MGKIIKASLYKLTKDWNFKITLIIGAAVAVLMSMIYLGVDLLISSSDAASKLATGQNLLFSALSPVQGFAIAVPINLIIFTLGEYNCGTIRNKIIAGNKKINIYFCLLITGLIFTLSLMAVYALLSFGIGCICGGFNPTGLTTYGNLGNDALWKFVVAAIVLEVMITSFSIAMATITRSQGASMPIVLVVIIFLFFYAMISKLTHAMKDNTYDISMWFNPLYLFGSTTAGIGSDAITVDKELFAASLIVPAAYTVIFTVLGGVIFAKRDVK